LYVNCDYRVFLLRGTSFGLQRIFRKQCRPLDAFDSLIKGWRKRVAKEEKQSGVDVEYGEKEDIGRYHFINGGVE
jgi:hypothetical protein